MFKNPITPAVLSSTPTSTVELVKRIDGYTGDSRLIAHEMAGATMNLCHALVEKEIERCAEVAMDERDNHTRNYKTALIENGRSRFVFHADFVNALFEATNDGRLVVMSVASDGITLSAEIADA